jgi:hypothetical protein
VSWTFFKVINNILVGAAQFKLEIVETNNGSWGDK